MSRCFPFPPPGYEIKARPDNVDLTIKEKHKKHKDKKDKDKKERSERKEKEKSEGKHREGKDRKEKKHKDKKDKKKDKQSSSEKKKTVECLENHKAEKLCRDGKPINGVHEPKILVELGKRARDDGGAQTVEKITLMEQRQNGVNSKILFELGKRVRDDDGARDSRMVEKITPMEQSQTNLHGEVPEKNNGMLAEVDDRGSRNGFVGENKIKVGDGSFQVDKVKKKKEGKEKNEFGNGNGVGEGKNDGVNSKILFELGKRVRDDDGARDSRMVENITPMEQSQTNLHGEVPEKNNGMLAEVDARGSRNGFVGENKIKVGDGSSQVDKVEKKKEGKEKNEFGNGNCVGEGKNEGRDKKRKAEDKKRKKEKKKEKEKVKEMSKENIKQRANDGNFLSQGKSPTRKEPLVNGFLHGNGIRADHMSRAAFSSHQGNGFHPCQRMVVDTGAVIPNQKMNGKLSLVTEHVESRQTENNKASLSNHVVSNGLIEEKTTPSKTTISLAKVKQIVNDSVDGKLVENGRKMNGPAIDKKDNEELKMKGKLEETSSASASASVKAKEKIAISMKKKPPHPDLKYLSQILTVPTADPPQFDDQDWLYDSLAKRAKFSSSQVEWTKQVWAKAIQIESADVIAMPYVIPY